MLVQLEAAAHCLNQPPSSGRLRRPFVEVSAPCKGQLPSSCCVWLPCGCSTCTEGVLGIFHAEKLQADRGAFGQVNFPKFLPNIACSACCRPARFAQDCCIVQLSINCVCILQVAAAIMLALL